jgi:hypothetical protein
VGEHLPALVSGFPPSIASQESGLTPRILPLSRMADAAAAGVLGIFQQRHVKRHRISLYSLRWDKSGHPAFIYNEYGNYSFGTRRLNIASARPLWVATVANVKYAYRD